MNMMSRRADERRRSHCPHCHTVRGEAKSIVVGDGKRTIGYACPSCGHTWKHTSDDKSFVLKP